MQHLEFTEKQEAFSDYVFYFSSYSISQYGWKLIFRHKAISYSEHLKWVKRTSIRGDIEQ